MILDPLSAASNLVLGLVKNKQVQAWTRLFISLAGTGFVTFFGVFGLTTISLYASAGAVGSLVLGLAAGSLSMSTTILWLWRRHPLTKHIPIAVPGKVEDELNKALGDGLVATNLEEK